MLSRSAEHAVAALGDRTVAVAESLTGGYVCGALASVPGVSKILRGGVVAYTAEVKIALLGVSGELIDSGGTVQAEVARQMAYGVVERLGSQFGIATTGVAGPGPSEDHPAGTCFVAVVDGDSGACEIVELLLEGDREQVRIGCAEKALEIAARVAEQTRGLAC